MFDLNDPRDARAFIAETIDGGYPLLPEAIDTRELSDERALEIARRFFLEVVPPRLRGEPH